VRSGQLGLLLAVPRRCLKLAGVITGYCPRSLHSMDDLSELASPAMGQWGTCLPSTSDCLTFLVTSDLHILQHSTLCGLLSSKRYRPVALSLFLHEFHNVFVCHDDCHPQIIFFLYSFVPLLIASWRRHCLSSASNLERVVRAEVDRNESEPDDTRGVHRESDVLRLVEVLRNFASLHRVHGAHNCWQHYTRCTQRSATCCRRATAGTTGPSFGISVPP